MNILLARFLIILIELCLLVIALLVLVYQQLNRDLGFAPVVQVQGGLVRGIVQSVGDLGPPVHLYQGIRYAQAERFSRAQLVQPWEGVYDATEPRANCPMPPQRVEKGYLTNRSSEDCLYLNIWRPVGPLDRLRPVMVYIYGGSFVTGSIFKSNHDGRYLASKGDLIVVSLNYRMGAFGFLFQGGDDLDNANLGLHDPPLALHWVRDNIRAFGGDPSLITLFGNSAGAISIATLLLSPLLPPGSVRRAIIQSGAPFDLQTLGQAWNATRRLASYLKCPENSDNNQEMILCLKEKSMEEIVMANEVLGRKFRPHIGDYLIPVRPTTVLATGQLPYKPNHQKLDLMFGVVRDEGPSFVSDILPEYFSDGVTLTEQQLPDGLKAMVEVCYNNRPPAFNDSWAVEAADFYATQVLDIAEPSQGQLRNLIGTVYGDCHFTCPVLLYGEQMAKMAPSNQYYAYRLMVPAGGRSRVKSDCNEPWMGVCHGDELYYLFNVPEQLTPEQRHLGEDMISAWASFAWTGSPGPIGPNRVPWEQAFPVKDVQNPGERASFVTQFMALDPENYTMVRGMFEQRCDHFWGPRLLAS